MGLYKKEDKDKAKLILSLLKDYSSADKINILNYCIDYVGYEESSGSYDKYLSLLTYAKVVSVALLCSLLVIISFVGRYM